MIKIVSGIYGGRFIETPEGKSTRPTTNRVREAVFNSLCSNYSCNLSLEGAKVLDLFAGSGALGFEALSRGANHCVFCDVNAKVISTLKKNASVLKVSSTNCSIVKTDFKSDNISEKLLPFAPFDLVFLDPPYAFSPQVVFSYVKRFRDFGLVAKDALLYYEHSNKTILGCLGVELEVLYDKSFGEVGSTILRISDKSTHGQNL